MHRVPRLPPNRKVFALGLILGPVLSGLGAFALSTFSTSVRVSKSKRIFATALGLNEAVLRYHKVHGAYPTKAHEVTNEVGQKSLTDFDYVSDGTSYILIHPSLTGEFRWEPYVFQDGRLVAWPEHMPRKLIGSFIYGASTLPPNSAMQPGHAAPRSSSWYALLRAPGG